MKIIATLLLFLASFAVSAQTSNATWNLLSIPDKTGIIVGYIYQSYAIGTIYDSTPIKNITALRLICPTKGKSNPLIAIFWNEDEGSMLDHPVEIRLDRQIFLESQQYRWSQEKTLTYRPLSESGELINAMRNKHTISFSWIGQDELKRTTAFDLSTFNSSLDGFYNNCHI